MYRFSDADAVTAARGLAALAEEFSEMIGDVPDLRETLLDILGLIERLQSSAAVFSNGELQNICLGLETLLESNPMDWKAARLFSTLCPICGFEPTPD